MKMDTHIEKNSIVSLLIADDQYLWTDATGVVTDVSPTHAEIVLSEPLKNTEGETIYPLHSVIHYSGEKLVKSLIVVTEAFEKWTALNAWLTNRETRLCPNDRLLEGLTIEISEPLMTTNETPVIEMIDAPKSSAKNRQKR